MKTLVWATISLLTFFPSAARAQSNHNQVLALYSTRRDAEFSIVGEDELPRILNVGLASNLDYYSEFIDLSRFPDPGSKTAFRDFLRQKYRDIHFDLVVALQDAAIEFVNGYGATLFPETPIVYLTNRPLTTRRPNSTGLVQERNFAATIGLLRQLEPEVTRVYVVIGAADADKAYEQTVRQQLDRSAFGSGLTFTYLSGLTTTDLVQRLSQLPKGSAVYYILVNEDGAGKRFHPLDYVDRVAAAANAPTYCWVDSAMSHGIVGGSLYTQRDAVRQVGEVAVRVLRGESADSIPVAVLNLNVNQVDWRQLRKWRIDEARIPAGTLVKFRDPTAWDRYKTYILAVLTVVVLQMGLIAGLLIQRTRRRRAEAELRGNRNELRASYERNRDLGARLLNAQETERSRIARELHDDICQRMLLLTIDLESLPRRDGEGTATGAVEAARDIARSLHSLSHRLHPARLRVIGLVAALERLCAEVSRAGLAVLFEHRAVPSTLPPDLMLCVFRIVQEALQNAIKYSRASEVLVRVAGAPGELRLTVIDDGVGFDVDAAWRNGVGLISMVERVETIGGVLEIRSTPGTGTSVAAVIPLRIDQPSGQALQSALTI